MKNNAILLLLKKDHKHWELPGEKIEKNETIEEAAKREILEETGCKVELIKYWKAFEFKINNKWFKSHTFFAKIIAGRPKVMEEEFEDIQFISLKKNRKISFSPEFKGNGKTTQKNQKILNPFNIHNS